MSKEYERFRNQLPQRKIFFLNCAKLAFGLIHSHARKNWLRAICESDDEHLRAAVLLGFVGALAKEMPMAEYNLKHGRGRRPKIEEMLMIEAERGMSGLTTPQAVIKVGIARTEATAKKKAAAMRSRRYRAKKKNVTK